MNFEILSSHLGFKNRLELFVSSECIEISHDCNWFIVKTRTWYKWVLWNTKFDVYFNNPTRGDAMKRFTIIQEKLNSNFDDRMTS